MPWQARSVVSQREEFVALAKSAGANVTLLCRRFGISRETGHLWIRRHAAGGTAALEDQLRRPKTSPGKTVDAMERLIVELRGAIPHGADASSKRDWSNWDTRMFPRPARSQRFCVGTD